VGAGELGSGWEWAFIHAARGFPAIQSVGVNDCDESGQIGRAHALWPTRARCRACQAVV
jgi:hypothetical protein